MEGKTLVHFVRNDKDICILLKEGEQLSLENIVDVFVSDQPERSKREDFYGTEATVDKNGILTLETGERYDLNQPIEDAVL
jgi:hypothetical protein